LTARSAAITTAQLNGVAARMQAAS